MQTQTQLNKNRIIGAAEEKRDFTLKAGPELMRILSSSLYTNKPWAVVRELMANARDAVVAQHGQDYDGLGIDITVSDKTYTVRDYGTGLSHDDVMTLFSVYGLSTKSNENSSIGGFGVGSKSPFAYTQEFTVSSFYNGEMRVYHAILGQTGIPELSHIGTTPSEEPNGISFRIPLEARDTEYFSNLSACLGATLGVNVRVGGVSISKIKREKISDNVSIIDINSCRLSPYMRDSNGEDESSTFFHGRVFVGGIPYSCNSPDSRLSLDRIELPIGSVDISVSRESLEMTKKTEAALKQASKEYMDWVLDKARADVKDIKGKIKKLHVLLEGYPRFVVDTLIPNYKKEFPYYVYNSHNKFYLNDIDASKQTILKMLVGKKWNSAEILKKGVSDWYPEDIDIEECPETFIKLSSLPKPQRNKPTHFNRLKKGNFWAWSKRPGSDYLTKMALSPEQGEQLSKIIVRVPEPITCTLAKNIPNLKQNILSILDREHILFVEFKNAPKENLFYDILVKEVISDMANPALTVRRGFLTNSQFGPKPNIDFPGLFGEDAARYLFSVLDSRAQFEAAKYRLKEEEKTFLDLARKLNLLTPALISDTKAFVDREVDTLSKSVLPFLPDQFIFSLKPAEF